MAAGERQTDNEKVKPIFCELSVNDSEPEVTEIESLCMDCGKNVYNLYPLLDLLNLFYFKTSFIVGRYVC